MIASEAAPGISPASAPTASQHGTVVMGSRGMVSTTHPLSAVVGLEMLMRGGHAVDAAIAIAAVNGVVQPMRCGLGGDAFAIVYEAKSGKLTAINGSGAAPRAATRRAYLERGLANVPRNGVLSVAVPGAVDAYATLWERFGRLPWADLFGPAIRYARAGHPVTERMSARIAACTELLAAAPTSARVFLPNGRPPEPGETLAQADLAATLEGVAAEGRDGLYRGPVAAEIARFCRETGGLLDEADLAAHASEVYEPIMTSYRGYDVHETAPPSQGLIVLETLNILEGFDPRAMGHLSADAIHTTVEALKLAFRDRLDHCGDPRFVDVPLGRLISKEHAAQRRAMIDPRRARRAPTERLGDPGNTTYFAVVDGEGNAVSFIHSLFGSFGSGLVAGRTGVVLNNRARGFTLAEGDPNVLEPGKRTMHTLNCYLITRDGRFYLAGGTPGGDMQVQWNVQTITAILDHGLNVQAAAEAPRWYLTPGTDPEERDDPFELRVENRVAPEVLADLSSRGHRIAELGPWNATGDVQLIMADQDRGVLLGAADPRSGGLAMGF